MSHPEYSFTIAYVDKKLTSVFRKLQTAVVTIFDDDNDAQPPLISAKLSPNLQPQTKRSRPQRQHFTSFSAFCVRNSEAAALAHNQNNRQNSAMAAVVDFASAFRFVIYDLLAALIAIINAPIVVYNLWCGLRLTKLSPQIRLHIVTIALLTIATPLCAPYDLAMIFSSE